MNTDNYESLGYVTVLKITSKAVLVESDGEEIWIPQSVIFEDDLADLVEDEMCEINVKQWFYDKELA